MYAALVGIGAGSTLVLMVAIVAARNVWMIVVSAIALLSRDSTRRRTALEVLRLTGRKADKTRSYLPPPGNDRTAP